MNKRLSIKAISELSGVSVATVSRVINQNGRFSQETERCVKEVIAKHGYVPNMIARGLRTNQLPIVGIIVPDITNEFFAKIVLEVQMLLFEHAYSAIICNTNESEELERMHLETLRAQNVSGLIYISGGYKAQDMLLDVPTIYIDRSPEGEQAKESIVIASDNDMGGYMAVNELITQGCQNIAILIDKRGHSSRRDRLNGYHRALKEHGLAAEEALFVPVAAVGYDDAFEGTMKLIQSGRPFDGIVCGTDWLAIGALAALRQEGIAVPTSVKVVGFDDIRAAQMHALPITTVRQDTKRMAQIAAEQLLLLMEGKAASKSHWLLPTQLIRRATT